MTIAGKVRFVNGLTFARVPLIAIWAVLALLQECAVVCERWNWGALWLGAGACLAMLLSGLTDLWDGKLARRWGVVSTLGKMADPLMDKVFFIVALPLLVWQAMNQGQQAHALMLLFLTVLYMLRDTWVTFMRMIGTLYGADVSAMWLGKVRTALSFPGIGWIYTYFSFQGLLHAGALKTSWFFSCIAVETLLLALTLWSLVSYSRAYAKYLKMALDQK